ncbi:hypothetical protein OJ997_33455 [Solirubrobacter phytolaccae]|uniref:Uncharacterized protein n=1 Tax=Solirubrobacter phytolaccae TaxID=1404360 RepID=A0A9X3NEJ1_9ACTN|nr:hypothetical protein [Solirubrobacter phytolaccae]MDA0185260.1 hypothetical protein [Solirubrobacter phytolaccae]
MIKDEMLKALQADVNAWPKRVKAAGVTNAGGAAYTPQARNLEILRTPDDPEATYAYMLRAWESPDADQGSASWERIISQAGPRATWEWLMADPEAPYAPLFDDLRERVRTALEAHPSYAAWHAATAQKAAEQAEDTARIQRVMDEMRSGKRRRPTI